MSLICTAASAAVVAIVLLLLVQLPQHQALSVSAAPAEQQLQCVEKLSSCSCRLSDGQIIDLSPVQASPGPAFNYDAPDGYTYQYNPCAAYKCGAEGDAALCQEKMQIIIQYVDFGVQASAQFDNDPATGGLRLRYLSRDMGRTSVINLICDPGAADASFRTDGAQGGGQLTADLRTRYACPHAPSGAGGMSGGDILLIVCFTLLAVYLIAGILVNYLMRQRRSCPQMLPNLEFWSALPSLVADGGAFVYGKARDLTSGGRGGYTDVK